VVVAVHQPGAALGFTVLEVGGALGLDHRPWNAQPDAAVDFRAVPGVLDGDFIAEEFRRLGAGVRDQRLLLGEFQFEVVAQELGEAFLDLFGFGLRPGEPEEVVVGLCRAICYAELAGARAVNALHGSAPAGTPRRRI
jgi:hypothetical protein